MKIWELSFSVRRDVTKVIAAFRHFANFPNKEDGGTLIAVLMQLRYLLQSSYNNNNNNSNNYRTYNTFESIFFIHGTISDQFLVVMVVAHYRLNTSIIYNYFALLRHVYLLFSKYVLRFKNKALIIRLNIFLHSAPLLILNNFLLQHSVPYLLRFVEVSL